MTTTEQNRVLTDLQFIADCMQNAQELLGIIKTNTDTAKPLSDVLDLMTHAVSRLDAVTERDCWGVQQTPREPPPMVEKRGKGRPKHTEEDWDNF